jgi:hypothetical protein
MTFVKVTVEGEELEVFHFPRELGMFPSFFDSAKQCDVVGSDLIFRRIRPVDQSRFDKTTAALTKGTQGVWCGIGKSTEANFVLFEFLRRRGQRMVDEGGASCGGAAVPVHEECDHK